MAFVPSIANSLSEVFPWADFVSCVFALVVSVKHLNDLKLAPKPSVGEPWPYPKWRALQKSTYIVSPYLTYDVPSCAILDRAVERLQKEVEKLLEDIQPSFTKTEGLGKEAERGRDNAESRRIIQTQWWSTEIIKVLTVNTSCSDSQYPNMRMDESCKFRFFHFVSSFCIFPAISSEYNINFIVSDAMLIRFG